MVGSTYYKLFFKCLTLYLDNNSLKKTHKKGTCNVKCIFYVRTKVVFCVNFRYFSQGLIEDFVCEVSIPSFMCLGLRAYLLKFDFDYSKTHLVRPL